MPEERGGPEGERVALLEDAVARARSGDGRAFDEIYRILAGPVFSYLITQTRRREDAEDLTGQVFLEAMRGIRGFTGDASAFRGWLFRIAHNRAVDLARRLARRREESLEEAEGVAELLGTEERAIAGVAVQRVWKAIESLPEQQRRVLVLRLGAGLTAREIAEALDKRIGTVKALQHRALNSLSRALRDLGDATDRPPPTL
jgi:RNA polymerase sigma-70 factor (ECF subfamily)